MRVFLVALFFSLLLSVVCITTNDPAPKKGKGASNADRTDQMYKTIREDEFDCRKWDGKCSDSDTWVCVNSSTGRRFNGMYQCHPCRAKYVVSYKLGRCPK